MTSRTWADGPTGNTPITSVAMNGIEADLDARVQKGDLSINVTDYGAIGDGTTDDTTALQNAFNAAAGKTLSFGHARNYLVTSTITVPANVTMVANGSKFIKNAAGFYGLTIGSGFTADTVELQMAGDPTAQDRGIYLNGDDIRISRLKVTCLQGDTWSGVGYGLMVGDSSSDTATMKKNIIVESISITGLTSPMKVMNVTNSTLNNIEISNFITAVYVVNVVNTVFQKAYIHGTSPKSATGPYNGMNGVLIESHAADFTSMGLRFYDWLVDGSPEHGYRIGGSFSAKDIYFTNCVARNTGNAPGNVSTGGSGFKAVGLTGGHWHINIFYTNCVVEDANTSGSGINNFTGFNMNFVKNLVITNPVVRAQNNVYSAQLALYLNSIDTASVVNPMFKDTKSSCIYIARDGTDSSLQGVQNVRIVGGHAGCNTASTSIAVRFDTQESITQNVFIEDLTVSSGTMALRLETPTTVGANTGAYTNIFTKIRYINAPTASANPPVEGGNYCYVDYSGPIYGSYGIPGLDGSYYLDTGTGKRYIRKTAAWVQQ